jgi:hypothetical protein
VNLSVGGDAEGGWLVDIHDGVTNAVHKFGAECKTAKDAAIAAIHAHFGGEPAQGVTADNPDAQALLDAERQMPPQVLADLNIPPPPAPEA